MESAATTKNVTRRQILQATVTLSAGALLGQLCSAGKIFAAYPGYPQQAPPDQLEAIRAQFGGTPIQTQNLTENIFQLSGPGGNIVVLTGPDGKLMGDTFVAPAWPKLKATLDGLGTEPLKTAIDTHWHFDHADNNGPLRAAGATVVAHENTKKRMSETHQLAVINVHTVPSPPDALPQQTFKQSHKLRMNGEVVTLTHLPPAHTDGDIYLHFQKANIVQTGDVFFNGMYPYIDGGTGGSVSGMIAASTALLAVVDDKTKIVPGHGPLGNKADLVKYRAMLTEVRARLQKVKSSGKSLEEAVAAKPLEGLEDAWGKGLFNNDAFVQMAYPIL
jgi:cyclase